MRSNESTDQILEQYAKEFPALINPQQACEIAQVPKGTVYEWSSRGELDHIKHKVGRHLRLERDGFIRFLLGTDN